jgi:hypothetical protein
MSVYRSGTLSVYRLGGLMFSVYSGIVLFHWFYYSGLFGFAILVYFGSIVLVSSSWFIRILFRFDWVIVDALFTAIVV